MNLLLNSNFTNFNPLRNIDDLDTDDDDNDKIK